MAVPKHDASPQGHEQPLMAKGLEIPKTDSAEIEILIERLKQNK